MYAAQCQIISPSTQPPPPPPPPRSDILFEVFPEQNLKLKETKAKTTFLYNDK